MSLGDFGRGPSAAHRLSGNPIPLVCFKTAESVANNTSDKMKHKAKSTSKPEKKKGKAAKPKKPTKPEAPLKKVAPKSKKIKKKATTTTTRKPKIVSSLDTAKAANF